jgi:3-hydroxyisobutyrate dehydrogenase
MTDARRVGVIGLGSMGSRIAAKLVEAGHEVHVWDRNERATQKLAARGAAVAATPAELATQVDTAISVLTNDEAVREVVIESGLLLSLPDGSVFADLSTTSVELALALAAAGREAGIDVLDVEMSGSISQVEAGELVLFVGGDEAVLERMRPLLEPLSKVILHMGPHGSGAKMKLAVNTLLGVGMQALAEAIAYGEAVGLDRDRLLDGLGQLTVVAPALKSKLDNARKGEYPVAFALRLMHKDFGLVLGHAAATGLVLPAAAASAEVCAAELAAEPDDVDFSAVIQQMQRQAALRA